MSSLDSRFAPWKRFPLSNMWFLPILLLTVLPGEEAMEGVHRQEQAEMKGDPRFKIDSWYENIIIPCRCRKTSTVMLDKKIILRPEPVAEEKSLSEAGKEKDLKTRYIKHKTKPVSSRGRTQIPASLSLGLHNLRLLLPVNGGRLTSPYGLRGNNMHWGIDLAAPEGRPVYSAAAGRVSRAGWARGYGLLVVVNHGEYQTYYAHNSRLNVEKGQEVLAGEPIARVGRTGNATGSHLHFELEIGGLKVNPLPFFKDQTNKP